MTRHESAQTRLPFRPEELAGVRVLDPDVELPRRAWRPIGPVTREAAPRWPQVAWVASVACVDGRDHLDADERIPAELVTVAVGAVTTTPGHPQATLRAVRRERLLVHGMGLPVAIEARSPASDGGASGLCYRGVAADSGTPEALKRALEVERRRLEGELAGELRAEDDERLLVGPDVTSKDGPSPGRLTWARAEPVVHRPAELPVLLDDLRRGQRSPLLRVGTSAANWFVWYVALAGVSAHLPQSRRLARFGVTSNDLARTQVLAAWTAAWAPALSAHACCGPRHPAAPLLALHHALTRELTAPGDLAS